MPPRRQKATAARAGQYFFDSYGLNNSTTAAYASLKVNDGTTVTTLPAFLAPSNFTNVYDADGNLTDNGRWAMVYDGENRLTWIQTSAPAVTAGATNEAWGIGHDYLGRRVIKAHYTWGGSTWVLQSQERYIYNGWNLIAVGDPNMNISKNYFWGLDLSGTMQGAGGVGGLLMAQDGGNTYLPMYDGNGNVHGMIKASDGSIAAAYEYDAFGNVLRESGPYAASNPFQFSTKYTDIETGLVYYGLRYYSPSLGRFINKDPIEEKGGLNLYGFCGNNGVNGYDLLGMDGEHIHWLFGLDHPEWTDAQYQTNVAYTMAYSNSHDAGSFNVSGLNTVDSMMYGGGGPEPWIHLFDNGDESKPPPPPKNTAGSNTSDISITDIPIDGAPAGTLTVSDGTNTISYAPNSTAQRYTGSELQPVGTGYGDIYHRTYTATMNTQISATTINNAVQGNINNFTGSWNPLVDTPFTGIRGSSLAIQLGNVYQIDGPGPVNPLVAVTGLTDSSFTFTTMQGHPEAGSITFGATQAGPETVIFTIESVAQSSSMLNAAAYNTFGQRLQTAIWTNVLQNVITYSGGNGSIGITTQSRHP